MNEMSNKKEDDDSWDFKIEQPAEEKSAGIDKDLGEDDSSEDVKYVLEKKSQPTESEWNKTKTKKNNDQAKKKRIKKYHLAGLGQRLMSVLIDVLMLSGIFHISKMKGFIYFIETVCFDIFSLLSLENSFLNNRSYLFIFINFVILSMTFYMVPILFFKRSFGKKICKVRIYSSLGEAPTSKVLFMREAVFKPLSLMTVIGVLVIFIDKKRRGFHDKMADTIIGR